MQEELIEIKKALEGLLTKVNGFMSARDTKAQRGELIIAAVCLHGGLTQEQLLKPNRKRGIMACRKMACYVLMDYCGWSSYRVATRLNLKRHGSVLGHRNDMRGWMKEPLYMPVELLEMTEKVLIDSGYEKK